jgi:hypothetical protein
MDNRPLRATLTLCERSVIAVDNAEGPALGKPLTTPLLGEMTEERVGDLERFLKVPRPKEERPLLERVKLLEDKVLWIEEHYPQVAVACFDHTPDRAATQRKGRVTQVQQYYHPTDSRSDADKETEASAEMLRRLKELRKKIKKR